MSVKWSAMMGWTGVGVLQTPHQIFYETKGCEIA
jgi:hypothetical protein